MKTTLVSSCILTSLFSLSAHADIIKWSSTEGGNNHYYEVVYEPSGVSWEQARDQAKAKGGILVALDSPGEENFVQTTLIDDPKYYFSIGGLALQLGPWIGGHRDLSTEASSATWYWLNGEAITTFNWAMNQPSVLNNTGHYLRFMSDPYSVVPLWGNDYDSDKALAYVIEYAENPEEVTPDYYITECRMTDYSKVRRYGSAAYFSFEWEAAHCDKGLPVEGCKGALSKASDNGQDFDWMAFSPGEDSGGFGVMPNGGVTWWSNRAGPNIDASVLYFCPEQ